VRAGAPRPPAPVHVGDPMAAAVCVCVCAGPALRAGLLSVGLTPARGVQGHVTACRRTTVQSCRRLCEPLGPDINATGIFSQHDTKFERKKKKVSALNAASSRVPFHGAPQEPGTPRRRPPARRQGKQIRRVTSIETGRRCSCS
jgi:hypothetical protein